MFGKTFSLTISGSEWFSSRKTIRELKIRFRVKENQHDKKFTGRISELMELDALSSSMA
jgi:hypothetical protein